jgi:carboxylesterase type B
LLGTDESLPCGGKYLSFKGIPYAKPPIGDLRYRVRFSKCSLSKMKLRYVKKINLIPI